MCLCLGGGGAEGRREKARGQSQWIRVLEDSGLPINRAASAEQNVTNRPNLLREKPEEWPQCLAHKLNIATERKTAGFHSNTARDWWIPYQQSERLVDSTPTKRKAGGFHTNRVKGWWIPYQQSERLVDSIPTERKTGGFHTNRAKDW